jgi:putative SOS response-associated peptidase YedK
MCGRYTTPEEAEAERWVRPVRIQWEEYERSYNVAPSQQVPVVRMADGEREGLMMRWGLVPFFARGLPPKYSTINASIEKLTDAPRTVEARPTLPVARIRLLRMARAARWQDQAALLHHLC